MEPANGEGLGAFGGAVAMALIVAVVVLLMMVNIGGGLTRPMFAPHVATAQASSPGQG
jgi:hypothetical protein